MEKKKNIFGNEEILNCEWIAMESHFGIVKHVAEQKFCLGDINLEPGNVSYRFHWPNRSYNLFKVFNAEGELVCHCFKLVDSVAISEMEIVWRDLCVNLLVFSDGEAKVINGEERPSLTDTWLHIYIEANKQQLLRKYQTVIEETDKLLEKYAAGG